MLAPNTWLRDYAPGYCHLSKGERRAVNDFVMLWSLYEAQVLDRNASAAKMVATIDHWHQAGLLDEVKSDDSWSHFVERLRHGDDVSHRFAGLRLTSVEHVAMVKAAILHEESGPDQVARHKAMAIIIHRIRNNLLHGEKWSYGLQDQLGNFQQGSHMLMLWMNMHRVCPLPGNG